MNTGLKLLTPDVFLENPVVFAPKLLGKILVRKWPDGQTVGARIVEVESYRQDDPASHSFKGPTQRNLSMFEQGGQAYVYFIYGNYFCLNIVTEPQGIGSAVLIRAVEPLWGLDILRQNRAGRSDVELTRGPGKLCQALDLGREHDREPLNGDVLGVYEDTKRTSKFAVVKTTRIGLKEIKPAKQRFYIKGNVYVSRV